MATTLETTIAVMLTGDNAKMVAHIDRMLAVPGRSRLAQDFLLDRRNAFSTTGVVR